MGLACVIVILAIHTRSYASAWQSNVTLWRHAVMAAPQKPRPWLNYGTALMAVGRIADAQAAWRTTIRVSDLPQVPAWDRAAQTLAQQNMDTLQRIVP